MPSILSIYSTSPNFSAPISHNSPIETRTLLSFYSSVGLCVKVRACDSKQTSAALNSSRNYTSPANAMPTLLLYIAFFFVTISFVSEICLGIFVTCFQILTQISRLNSLSSRMEFKLNFILPTVCHSASTVKYVTKCSRITWILSIFNLKLI